MAINNKVLHLKDFETFNYCFFVQPLLTFKIKNYEKTLFVIASYRLFLD